MGPVLTAPEPTRGNIRRDEDLSLRLELESQTQVASYSAPVGEMSIAISLSVCLCVCLSVCLSVCPRAYLWNRWTDLHEIFLCRSPVAVARSSSDNVANCDTLCTSCCMNDVTFRRYGPYGDAWKAEPFIPTTTSGVAIPGAGAESDVYECLVCKL